MASLTITVPDAVVPRIRTAFGHQDPITLLWIDATVVEVQDGIKNFVHGKVIDYETTQNAIADRAAKSAEVW